MGTSNIKDQFTHIYVDRDSGSVFFSTKELKSYEKNTTEVHFKTITKSDTYSSLKDKFIISLGVIFFSTPVVALFANQYLSFNLFDPNNLILLIILDMIVLAFVSMILYNYHYRKLAPHKLAEEGVIICDPVLYNKDILADEPNIAILFETVKGEENLSMSELAKYATHGAPFEDSFYSYMSLPKGTPYDELRSEAKTVVDSVVRFIEFDKLRLP